MQTTCYNYWVIQVNHKIPCVMVPIHRSHAHVTRGPELGHRSQEPVMTPSSRLCLTYVTYVGVPLSLGCIHTIFSLDIRDRMHSTRACLAAKVWQLILNTSCLYIFGAFDTNASVTSLNTNFKSRRVNSSSFRRSTLNSHWHLHAHASTPSSLKSEARK